MVNRPHGAGKLLVLTVGGVGSRKADKKLGFSQGLVFHRQRSSAFVHCAV